MSAFESKNVGYSYGYKNTEDLMKKVGCIDIEANEDFKKKPETDTMGVCIGRKEIELTDGTTQPVMIRPELPFRIFMFTDLKFLRDILTIPNISHQIHQTCSV